MRTMNAFCLLLCFVSAAALEARWTPAADGGPARFSKRYRDAAGIDDSKWTEPDAEEGVSTSTLLLAAALVLAGAYVLHQERQKQGGNRVGGGAAAPAGGRRAPTPAAEAARRAFLDKFQAPGSVAAPESWNARR